MRVTDHMQRFGLLLPPQRRPTLVLAGGSDQIDTLYATVDAALRLRAGYRLVLAAPPEDVAALRSRYQHETVLPLPPRVAASLWRQRLDVRLVIAGASLSWLAGDGSFMDGAAPPQAARLAQSLPPVARELALPSAGPFLVDLLGGRRIASLQALAARLGGPRSIVCLGNGPSSEDPRLTAHGDSTLFRVNWNYRRRQWMNAPHVVFTADADLPPLRNRPILVFPSAAAGRPVLLRHTLLFRPPTPGYVFLDEFEPPPADLSGSVIPTNGALMIAIAAALQPQRIVIAGIDLYRHAEGRYPGAGDAVEGYAREHSREADLRSIRSALAGFGGEVVHLSENLREALAESPL